MPKQIENDGINGIVGALTDPIIVFPGGWGETLPEWLKTAITLERLEMNMKLLKGEEPTGTDAEACAYIMTASLNFPLDADWTNIFLYVSSKTCSRWKKTEIPPDIQVKSLSDYELKQLDDLKRWLYEKRVKLRKHEPKTRLSAYQRSFEQLKFF